MNAREVGTHSDVDESNVGVRFVDELLEECGERSKVTHDEERVLSGAMVGRQRRRASSCMRAR